MVLVTQSTNQNKKNRNNEKGSDIYFKLKLFNKMLKELDQLLALFSVFIIVGSFLFNINDYEWSAFSMFIGGLFGVLWIVSHGLIHILVESEINVKRLDIIVLFTFGIVAISYIILGIFYIYNPPQTNFTIKLPSKILNIKINKEEILKIIINSINPYFIIILFILGVITSLAIYPPKR